MLQADLLAPARIAYDRIMIKLHIGGIPSTPGDLLSFIDVILLPIITGVTTNCHK